MSANDPFHVRIPAFGPDLSALSKLQQVVPKIVMPDSPAKAAFKRLAKVIAEFEAALSLDDEIGLRLIATPAASTMHIVDIGYATEILIFHGRSDDGKPMQLLQHYSQMSVLLTSVPKIEPEPRRIGFDLVQRAAS